VEGAIKEWREQSKSGRSNQRVNGAMEEWKESSKDRWSNQRQIETKKWREAAIRQQPD
jgi:hypothetical protein